MQDTIDHIKAELLPEFDFEQYDRIESNETKPAPVSAPDPIAESAKIETAPVKESDDGFASSDLKWD